MHSLGVQGWGFRVSGLGLRVLPASSIKTDCGKLKRSEYSHGQSDRHINVKSSHSLLVKMVYGMRMTSMSFSDWFLTCCVSCYNFDLFCTKICVCLVVSVLGVAFRA